MLRSVLFISFIITLLGNTYGQAPNGHYADVNGLHLYYEVHGSGQPLLLVHGGGSTIETSFGRLLPDLAKKYKVIAVDMQAHGRTKDNGQPLSFEHDADNLSALLEQLNIKSAAVFGFSNGATTAMQMAIRHPQQVDRLILASALYKRTGVDSAFWGGFDHAELSIMPKPLADGYLKVNNDQKGLQTMFERDVQRMKNFKDISDVDVRRINAPALIVSSDQDVIKPEHSVELYRLLPHGQLIILPGFHGEWMGALESSPPNNPLPALALPMLEKFMDARGQ